MPVKIFLAVSTSYGKVNEVQKKLKEIDEVVLSCSVSNGQYDVVAMVEVRSLDDYRSISIDKVSSIQNIIDYTSFIIMEE